ncbi:hypothetical protein EC973_002743 [Apophysomyces ossiformis]|uniref:Homeobox domain-containing protein n=1 Tax=Apophysomyces ossiformis TaxID=679940 RepID=A0A8H7ESC6_9FUNG|nr:hypothetical protein EC973_002743 [Apophysomyces ossiformis]
MKSSTCTLPPISDIFTLPLKASSSVLDVNGLLASPISSNDSLPSPTSPTSHPSAMFQPSHYPQALKAKRKRASPSQLSVLNKVFSQTYFPSTELRIELGKQLGMSPRTVQIWFQNKRQSLRTRGRHAAENYHQHHHHHSPPTPSHHQHHHHPAALPPISPPRSPHYSYHHHPHQQQQQQQLPYHHQQLPPSPPSQPCSQPISLPPLRLPPPSFPPSPSSNASYPSPSSSIVYRDY